MRSDTGVDAWFSLAQGPLMVHKVLRCCCFVTPGDSQNVVRGNKQEEFSPKTVHEATARKWH